MNWRRRSSSNRLERFIVRAPLLKLGFSLSRRKDYWWNHAPRVVWAITTWRKAEQLTFLGLWIRLRSSVKYSSWALHDADDTQLPAHPRPTVGVLLLRRSSIALGNLVFIQRASSCARRVPTQLTANSRVCCCCPTTQKELMLSGRGDWGAEERRDFPCVLWWIDVSRRRRRVLLSWQLQHPDVYKARPSLSMPLLQSFLLCRHNATAQLCRIFVCKH